MAYQEDRDTLADKVASGRVVDIEEERSGNPSKAIDGPDSFKHHLGRFASPIHSTWLGEGKATMAVDFHLDARTPLIAKRTAKSMGYWRLKDFQRGAGTNRSVAILDQTDTGGYSLREYCLRLPEPKPGGSSWEEMQQTVASLVREISPPPGTAVWCRNTQSFLIKTPEYYRQKIVHIGSEESACRPSYLLDFIAELMPAYRERFL